MSEILALRKVRKTRLKTSLSYTYIARSHIKESKNITDDCTVRRRGLGKSR